MNPITQNQNTGQITNVANTNTGNVDVPSTIDSTQIPNAKPIQVPPVPPQPNLVAGLPQQLQQTADTSTAQQGTEQSKLIDLMNQLTGQTAETQAQQDALGVTQNLKDLNELNKLSNKQMADYLAGYVSAEGARNTRQETNVVQQNLTRQHGIDALLTNSLISAKQGDINFANTLVDRAIAAKYDPIKQRIEIQKTILDQVNTKAAEDRKNALDMQLKQYDKLSNFQSDAIKNAISNNAPQDILNKINNATSISDITKVGGNYLVSKADQLDQKLKQAQIANTYANMVKTKAETAQLGATGGKPATDTQITNAGYATRIAQANQVIDNNLDTFKNMGYAKFKLIESNSPLANKLLSPEEQKVAQAMRSFITAKLRKESGAAISPTEFTDARKTYFPQYGDSAEVLAQKKATRDAVLQNNIQGAGPAYKQDTLNSYLDTVSGVVSDSSVSEYINSLPLQSNAK